ncbi:hypothetical protein BD779DRAFT_1477620 [Infundibulicybe gibba]|nr:hypothetical protein BD779DRAFT_1478283 [Infundibulicybe gibba]KAF8872356.1 hypothetical protein BD779DRAFT_1477620 [Infundibulicybe gibba]
MCEIVGTIVELLDRLAEVDVPADLGITAISRYNPEFLFPIAFPPQSVTKVHLEWPDVRRAALWRSRWTMRLWFHAQIINSPRAEVLVPLVVVSRTGNRKLWTRKRTATR